MRPDAYAARMIIPAYAIVSFTVACEYRADSSTRARLSSSWSIAANGNCPSTGDNRAPMYGHASRVLAFQSCDAAHSSAKSSNR